MLKIETYTPSDKPTTSEKEAIAEFLFRSLEQYGDPKADILKCMNYALKETSDIGGFIFVAFLGDEIVGATIINQTGMKDYIPENILVYIATDAEKRGQGIGRQLMEKAIATTEGNIALHVEADNPAKKLYEKLGFTNKYLEMRLVK
ncbi:GNAT family N-acetyltransferase [Halpernia frigidisoli]|uniref:Acetyltransferase (GNAT) domain-containing protein n=1 Tax=Halpernia frigidisoli TaxID=1125876 RepID=A0A1I3HWI7_9FLAO|nr:GNAT family N-acetyltransferase [Halpernia frigidisoli]SFI40032.1 Acetyltransferase (GNAT) domain-containing protein [Halpernia frigidisoli]